MATGGTWLPAMHHRLSKVFSLAKGRKHDTDDMEQDHQEQQVRQDGVENYNPRNSPEHRRREQPACKRRTSRYGQECNDHLPAQRIVTQETGLSTVKDSSRV